MFRGGAWRDWFAWAFPPSSSQSQGNAGGLLAGLDALIAGASEEKTGDVEVGGVDGGAVFSPSTAMDCVVLSQHERTCLGRG